MIDALSVDNRPLSVHRRVNLFRGSHLFGGYNDGKRLLKALKKALTDCGWVVTQTFPGRLAMKLVGIPQCVEPCSALFPCPGVMPPPAPCPDTSSTSDFIGGTAYFLYDPLRSNPPVCLDSMFIAKGTCPGGGGTDLNFAAAVSAALGGSFSIVTDPTGTNWILWTGASLEACDLRITGYGVTIGYPYNPFYTSVGGLGFAVNGAFDAGWELVSPDGTTTVELLYVVDNPSVTSVHPPALSGGNGKNPCVRVKANDGSGYNFTAILSPLPSQYHIYASDLQFAVWADGYFAPAGRPTALFVMAPLPAGNQPVAFGLENLTLTGNISPDGSSFSGDGAPPDQVRRRLFWNKGIAQNFDAVYTQTDYRPGSGYDAAWPGFVCRGFDNSRSMLFSNQQPLLENAYLMLTYPGIYKTGTKAMMVGKVWDALLMSARLGTTESITRFAGRLWHLFCDQFPARDNVNLSLWLSATEDEDNTGKVIPDTGYDSIV